ncbi:unnamed protein product, partial [Ectocarpus sp. 8 AP-2014]
EGPKTRSGLFQVLGAAGGVPLLLLLGFLLLATRAGTRRCRRCSRFGCCFTGAGRGGGGGIHVVVLLRSTTSTRRTVKRFDGLVGACSASRRLTRRGLRGFFLGRAGWGWWRARGGGGRLRGTLRRRCVALSLLLLLVGGRRRGTTLLLLLLLALSFLFLGGVHVVAGNDCCETGAQRRRGSLLST